MRAYGLSKPHTGEPVSGDAWLCLPIPSGLRVALVDGSGHGPAAASAAALAVEALTASIGQPLDAALVACHEALRSSRGAAVSVCDLTPERLVFAGVGNVEGRVVTPAFQRRMVPQRGILGAPAPRIRPEQLDLAGTGEWALLLHSDGIPQRMELDWNAIAACNEPLRLITEAVDRWGRPTDDATLVLVLQP